MKFVISIILCLNFCYADSVKVVKKGETVPFDGVLFTKEKEKEVRNNVENSEKKIVTLAKLNEFNEKEIDILNKRLELYQNKSRELADREVKNENNTFLKNSIYFLSGALITGLIGYGVIQAYR
jgi:hypothetical protein